MTREFPKNPEPKKVEAPTIGRVVLFFDTDGLKRAGIVANVYEDYVINIMVADHDGSTYPATMVTHKTEGKPVSNRYWDWMDYQKGQAAKTEQLEAKLKSHGLNRHIGDDSGKLQAGSPSPVDGKR